MVKERDISDQKRAKQAHKHTQLVRKMFKKNVHQLNLPDKPSRAGTNLYVETSQENQTESQSTMHHHIDRKSVV